MTDSGNSGAGTRTPDRPRHRGTCERCGHSADRYKTYLAQAISDWTGADYTDAARIAAKVWEETESARKPPGELVQLARHCTFCGAAVRQIPDGALVSTAVSPNADPVDDPTCPDSPTRTHALP